jgi:hypothetical protein
MAILVLLGFAFTALCVLAAVQTGALLLAGERFQIAFPFRHESDSALVRWSLKLALQAVLVAIIFLYPLAVGNDPGDYLSWLLVPDWTAFLRVAALTVAVFALQQLVLVWTRMVRVSRRYSLKKTARKVLRGCLTPVPLAVVEETVFRGILLKQLLDSLPSSRSGVAAAVFLSAIFFAAAHFFRPQKRTALPAIGLFVFGIVLAIAYLISGRSCWLPIAIHAGGVWMIKMTRPFVAYRGPAVLAGYSSYPMCGALGIAAMAVLTALIIVAGGA